MKKSITYN